MTNPPTDEELGAIAALCSMKHVERRALFTAGERRGIERAIEKLKAKRAKLSSNDSRETGLICALFHLESLLAEPTESLNLVHTCVLTGTTSDASVPPPCVACQAEFAAAPAGFVARRALESLRDAPAGELGRYLYCRTCNRCEGKPFAAGDLCPAHCGGKLVDLNDEPPAKPEAAGEEPATDATTEIRAWLNDPIAGSTFALYPKHAYKLLDMIDRPASPASRGMDPAIVERLIKVLSWAGSTIFLDGPCVFCGYNGSGYWQPRTHAAGCPWHSVGGYTERTKETPRVLSAWLDRPAPAAKEAGEHVWSCHDCGNVMLSSSQIDVLSDLVEPYRQRAKAAEQERDQLRARVAESEVIVSAAEALDDTPIGAAFLRFVPEPENEERVKRAWELFCALIEAVKAKRDAGGKL